MVGAPGLLPCSLQVFLGSFARGPPFTVAGGIHFLQFLLLPADNDGLLCGGSPNDVLFRGRSLEGLPPGRSPDDGLPRGRLPEEGSPPGRLPDNGLFPGRSVLDSVHLT